MFKSIFSSCRKWQKLVAVAFGAALLFSLMSCVQPTSEAKSETNSLGIYPISDYSVAFAGAWASSGSYAQKIEIPADSNANGLFKNYYSSGTWIETYTGNYVCYRPVSNTEGYIYIKYVTAMNPDWTYSATAPDVGKWYAIHIENFNGTSLKFAGAYKVGGVSATATLEEAVKTFTVGNGYFSTHDEVTKQ